MKFTDDEITEMGQYRMRAKSRHFGDIFTKKVKDQAKEEYLNKQKAYLKEEEEP